MLLSPCLAIIPSQNASGGCGFRIHAAMLDALRSPGRFRMDRYTCSGARNEDRTRWLSDAGRGVNCVKRSLHLNLCLPLAEIRTSQFNLRSESGEGRFRELFLQPAGYSSRPETEQAVHRVKENVRAQSQLCCSHFSIGSGGSQRLSRRNEVGKISRRVGTNFSTS